jgi:hypothetical protein
MALDFAQNGAKRILSGWRASTLEATLGKIADELAATHGIFRR